MDIEIIRLRSELIALEILTISTVRALQEAFPSFAQSLPMAGAGTSEQLRTLAVRHAPPEMSDLLTAELQEAWERLLKRALPPKN
jgi:hypothetical protein